MAIFNNITDGGDLKKTLDGKVNLDGSNAGFGNLSSTAKKNITNIVGWEKIGDFGINYIEEIEFTNLNDGYQHRFEFMNISSSENAYMMAALGNYTNYVNTGYSGCLFCRWSQATNQWLTESVGYENAENLIITSNQNEQWSLSRFKTSYINFEIKSNLSADINPFFEFNSMVNSPVQEGRLMITNGNGMLVGGFNFNRIKFYLSSGGFTLGTVKHYIMK